MIQHMKEFKSLAATGYSEGTKSSVLEIQIQKVKNRVQGEGVEDR